MKCKNCRNLVKRIDDDGTLYDFCGMVIDSPDTDRERNCKYYVNATNADRIRAMTDEELADWLGVYCNGQTAQEVGKPCASGVGSCEECWLDWLKQEVEE